MKMNIKHAQAMAMGPMLLGPSRPPSPSKNFRVPRNVVENKGPEIRKMGQMRIPGMLIDK